MFLKFAFKFKESTYTHIGLYLTIIFEKKNSTIFENILWLFQWPFQTCTLK